jgi:hypothetical protein
VMFKKLRGSERRTRYGDRKTGDRGHQARR